MKEMYFHEYNFNDFNMEDKFNYQMKSCDFLLVDACIMIREGEEEEIQCLEFVLSNGVSDNVYIEERMLLDCSRDMLSLIQFSFNNAKETDLSSLRQLVFKHIKLIQDAIEEEDVDYLKKIIVSYLQNSKVLYLESCKKSGLNENNIKTLDDVVDILDCYNKRYDKIKTVLRTK